MENQILGVVSGLACSPLVSGAALSSMEAFYGTLVTVDNQIAGHVIPSLTVSLERAGKDGSAANVSKCLASIVRCAMSMAAGTIAEFTKHVKVGSRCAKPPDTYNRIIARVQVQRKSNRTQLTDAWRDWSLRVSWPIHALSDLLTPFSET